MIAGDWAAKMYGDCQVMSNMEGNVAASENLFPSPIGNPNFSFFPTPNMPFHPFPSSFNINMPLPKQENGGLGLMMMMRGGKEEMESGSGSEQAVEDKSGNEQDSTDQQPPPDNDPNNNGNDNTIKKKRYHRHTQRQIQEMEALFKECPHPDDKQRMKLSQELGLKPRQVKFWFQNRRTQMKAQQDRSDNIMLRAENESLKNENYRLQAELRNLVCPNCGGPAMLGGIPFQELQLENARLREELEHVRSIASRFSGRPMQTMAVAPPPPPLVPSPLDLDMNMYSRPFPDSMSTCPQMMPMPLLTDNSSFPEAGLLLMEEEKINVALELAMSSADVLVKMCQLTKPLWIIDNENGKEVLNLEEHSKMFPWPLNLKQHSCEFRTEASRHSAVVIMNSINLVDAFLDAIKWMELFPSIVARAKTVQVISPGVSGPTGSLHLMYAELQVLSPLVPTRETYFLRFCQQNVEEGSWVIVDYPIDSFNDHYEPSFPMYRRRPSGCVIQDMPNGYSTVTWVEHAEVEEKAVHQIFSQLVDSGMAFGAQRWLAVLQRQCERVASLMARNISDLGVIPSPEARMNLMRVAQRMMRIFCLNISTGGGQSWTALSDSCDDTVRITTRKMTEPGQPNGVILSAVSTTFLPYSHDQVFDLLRDEHRRSQVDVLSNGNALQEVAHIANGSHPGNCISLLRINVASNSSQHVELMLQESCTDASGSIVVQSTVDVDSIQLAMSGEDPSCIPLLPQGFVIIPAPSVVNEDVALSTSPIAVNINQGRLLGSPDDNGQEESNVGGHGNGGSGNLSSSSGGGGCLLTVGLQVLASTIPSAKLNLSSVTAINNHLCNTVQQIGAALSRGGGGGGGGGGVGATSNAGCTDDVAVADVNIVGSSSSTSNAIVGSSCSEAAASTSTAAAPAASPN